MATLSCRSRASSRADVARRDTFRPASRARLITSSGMETFTRAIHKSYTLTWLGHSKVRTAAVGSWIYGLLYTCSHVQGPHLPARRRTRRHRLLRRARHLGRRRLDAREGRRPLHLHRRPRPVRRARHRRVPEPRLASTAPRSPASSTASAALVEEGLAALPCGAFHIRTGRPDRTSTPRRSAAPSPAPCWCGRCARTASTSGATARPTRATTSSGSTATACWPTRSLRIYKPWLDADFVDELGGRAEMSAVAGRARPALPRQRGEGVLHRRQHLGRHPRGQDARAPRRRRSRSSSRSWACAFWDPAVAIDDRGRHGRASTQGRPVADQRHDVRRRRSSWSHEANAIGGRHGLGMSDQIENRIIEAKSRGIYEAPGHGAAATSPTSGCSTRSTTRTPSPTTTPRAAGSAGCSTRAAGSTRRR